MTAKKTRDHEQEIADAIGEAHEEEKPENASKEQAKESQGTLDVTVAELTELVKRVQADYENYRKRAESEHVRFRELGRAQVLQKLLPVLDTLDKASAHDAEGFELIRMQLMSALESEGLKRMETVGKRLDPYLHECLCTQESDKQVGTVVEEVQAGYLLHQAVLRHAKVITSAAKKEANNDTLSKNT